MPLPHLIRNKVPRPPFKIQEPFKYEAVLVGNHPGFWGWHMGVFLKIGKHQFKVGEANFPGNWYNYCIRFRDYDPKNEEESRKHVMCVKNGKIRRFYNPISDESIVDPNDLSAL